MDLQYAFRKLVEDFCEWLISSAKQSSAKIEAKVDWEQMDSVRGRLSSMRRRQASADLEKPVHSTYMTDVDRENTQLGRHFGPNREVQRHSSAKWFTKSEEVISGFEQQLRKDIYKAPQNVNRIHYADDDWSLKHRREYQRAEGAQSGQYASVSGEYANEQVSNYQEQGSSNYAAGSAHGDESFEPLMIGGINYSITHETPLAPGQFAASDNGNVHEYIAADAVDNQAMDLVQPTNLGMSGGSEQYAETSVVGLNYDSVGADTRFGAEAAFGVDSTTNADIRFGADSAFAADGRLSADIRFGAEAASRAGTTSPAENTVGTDTGEYEPLVLVQHYAFSTNSPTAASTSERNESVDPNVGLYKQDYTDSSVALGASAPPGQFRVTNALRQNRWDITAEDLKASDESESKASSSPMFASQFQTASDSSFGTSS